MNISFVYINVYSSFYVLVFVKQENCVTDLFVVIGRMLLINQQYVTRWFTCHSCMSTPLRVMPSTNLNQLYKVWCSSQSLSFYVPVSVR